MGHRTNYIILEDGQYAIYYSHWDAVAIAEKLFYGAKPLLEYVYSLDMVEDLLDDIWAEASLVIDLDLHKVLFWGDEILSQQYFAIPFFIQLLEENTWPDWKIKYAFKGQVEIAEYIGIDPKVVMNKDKVEILESEILKNEYNGSELLEKATQFETMHEVATVLDNLLESHLKNLDFDPTTSIRRIIEEHRKKGEEVQVNPFALKNKSFHIDNNLQIHTIQQLTDWIYNLRGNPS